MGHFLLVDLPAVQDAQQVNTLSQVLRRVLVVQQVNTVQGVRVSVYQFKQAASHISQVLRQHVRQRALVVNFPQVELLRALQFLLDAMDRRQRLLHVQMLANLVLTPLEEHRYVLRVQQVNIKAIAVRHSAINVNLEHTAS